MLCALSFSAIFRRACRREVFSPGVTSSGTVSLCSPAAWLTGPSSPPPSSSGRTRGADGDSFRPGAAIPSVHVQFEFLFRDYPFSLLNILFVERVPLSIFRLCKTSHGFIAGRQGGHTPCRQRDRPAADAEGSDSVVT